MARPSTPPAERLRELNKALEKAKKLPRKTTLTAKPMCELLGVSWPTLLKWCDEIPGFATSNAFTRGAQGIEWTFRPVATITAIVKHYTAQVAQSKLKADRLNKTIGIKTQDKGEDALTLDEQHKALRNLSLVRDRQVLDGHLVLAADVIDKERRIFTRLLHAGLRAAQDFDPTGSLSPKEREVAENVSRAIIAHQRKILVEEIDGFDGGTA